MVIYLVLLLPVTSCELFMKQASNLICFNVLAPGGVYRASFVAKRAVSSYLTFPSLPKKIGGLFLLHFP